MSLPSSGTISILQIRDELEPGNGSALNLGFYIGRTYSISTGGTRTISAAPSMSEFYSLQNVAVALHALTASGEGVTNAWVGYRIKSNGWEAETYSIDGFAPTETQYAQWVIPSAFESNYEAMATILYQSYGFDGLSGHGAESFGPMDTWIPASTAWWQARAWTVGGSDSTSYASLQLLVSVRPTGGAVVSTAVINLYASATS